MRSMSQPATVPTPTLKRLSYSIDEVAAMTGLSPRFVRTEVWAGRLRSIKAGRRVLIPARAIEEYLDALSA